MKKNHVNLMIDSGAFTAWKQKTPINLTSYIKFIRGHLDLIDTVVNLDVIPEAFTQHKVEEAAEQGYKNLRRINGSTKGINILPVYHKGERRYWLEKMIGEGFDYIGLGGVATAGDKARRPWLDDVFHFLAKQNQKIKLHGFGITSVKMMKRYPWYSVDSVSWMKQAVMGMVYVPSKIIKGCYSYDDPPMSVLMSKAGRDGPSSLTLNANTNYWGMSPSVKSYCRKYFDETTMTPNRLARKYKCRVRLNARFFHRFAQQHVPTYSLGRPEGLISSGGKAADVFEVTKNPFKLIFSVGTYLEYANILYGENVRNQLISFHRIDTGPKFDLRVFVESGHFFRDTRKGTLIV